jgi:uncharacterized protein with PIN domain
VKRKTKNTCLLDVVRRQEREIASLLARIEQLEALERRRDEAWQKNVDERIREINTAIRSANQKQKSKE